MNKNQLTFGSIFSIITWYFKCGYSSFCSCNTKYSVMVPTAVFTLEALTKKAVIRNRKPKYFCWCKGVPSFAFWASLGVFIWFYVITRQKEREIKKTKVRWPFHYFPFSLAPSSPFTEVKEKLWRNFWYLHPDLSVFSDVLYIRARQKTAVQYP